MIVQENSNDEANSLKSVGQQFLTVF